MADSPRSYPFTVELDGQKHECERLVSGERTLRQEIHVKGRGRKADPASYGGTKGEPIQRMESVARLIAREIIGSPPPADDGF